MPTIILAQKLLAIGFELKEVGNFMLQNLIKQTKSFEDLDIELDLILVNTSKPQNSFRLEPFNCQVGNSPLLECQANVLINLLFGKHRKSLSVFRKKHKEIFSQRIDQFFNEKPRIIHRVQIFRDTLPRLHIFLIWRFLIDHGQTKTFGTPILGPTRKEVTCSLQVSSSLHRLTKIKTSGKVFFQFDDGGWFG